MASGSYGNLWRGKRKDTGLPVVIKRFNKMQQQPVAPPEYTYEVYDAVSKRGSADSRLARVYEVKEQRDIARNELDTLKKIVRPIQAAYDRLERNDKTSQLAVFNMTDVLQGDKLENNELLQRTKKPSPSHPEYASQATRLSFTAIHHVCVCAWVSTGTKTKTRTTTSSKAMKKTGSGQDKDDEDDDDDEEPRRDAIEQVQGILPHMDRQLKQMVEWVHRQASLIRQGKEVIAKRGSAQATFVQSMTPAEVMELDLAVMTACSTLDMLEEMSEQMNEAEAVVFDTCPFECRDMEKACKTLIESENSAAAAMRALNKYAELCNTVVGYHTNKARLHIAQKLVADMVAEAKKTKSTIADEHDEIDEEEASASSGKRRREDPTGLVVRREWLRLYEEREHTRESCYIWQDMHKGAVEGIENLLESNKKMAETAQANQQKKLLDIISGLKAKLRELEQQQSPTTSSTTSSPPASPSPSKSSPKPRLKQLL
ncbi:unnamed protein product [Vitrella brassicaformis CCMP3155]|uniref:Uncharacterized protein n=1 Tax=Vitrella brassicaformis (strain CCMP3155) TaxID=1169540 RepID=A0A0G4EWX5_VITBC|nr:unnamed protein product [Vitrella brassicaformis CCMP3155]|eukprot:CEM03278.1 unnamed protein product [Vitrella brassicaformis CCMP3155]